MVTNDQSYIEIPLGKIDSTQPSIIPTIRIPLPENTNPANILMRSNEASQSITGSTVSTLQYNDAIGTGDIQTTGGGTTLCILLFDDTTTIAATDIEVFSSVASATVNVGTDTLLYENKVGITNGLGAYLYPPNLLWLASNHFLNIQNESANTITVNRVITIYFPTYP